MRLMEIALVVAVIFVVCPACKNGEIEDPFAPPSPSPLAKGLQFDDIPAPRGFNLIESESYVDYVGPLRHGFLVYEGTTAAKHVTDFYARTMTDIGWTALGETAESPGTLVFEKSDERCSVTAKDVPAKTRVTIKVEPK